MMQLILSTSAHRQRQPALVPQLGTPRPRLALCRSLTPVQHSALQLHWQLHCGGVLLPLHSRMLDVVKLFLQAAMLLHRRLRLVLTCRLSHRQQCSQQSRQRNRCGACCRRQS